MALKCGIVGLPNVGKSTIFNALTVSSVPADNYPFCTVEPNLGIVSIPDDRPQKLAELLNSKESVQATVEFLDIAGLVSGASKGEGLGNQFLAHIREVAAIIHVVRCFENENISHVENTIDPVRDAEIVETELLLRDIETVEKRLIKLQKAVKSSDKEAIYELDFLKNILPQMNSGVMVRNIKFDSHQNDLIKPLFLLTTKPILYVANVDENEIISPDRGSISQKLFDFAENEGNGAVRLCGQLEMEIAEMESEDREMFLEEYKLPEPGLNKLIHRAFQLLDFETFFTVNENQAHAWTIRKGATAPEAAGVVHSDFQQGFIKADVYSCADLIKCKTEHALRETGKIRLEGKTYTVQDGDVLFFKFNL